jgi:preprotein translocase subunit SecG
LTESFASAESMFGAKTNELMVRATVILAAVFLTTSLALAHLSSKRERSLLTEVGKVPTRSLMPVTQPVQKDSPKVNMPTNKL